MPWGAAAGALVGAVANNALSSNKNGGAGTSTTDKSPWLPAQGWILDNLNSGKNLENAYLAQPQSAQQQAAVNNIYGQSDYMRGLIPSLLGQLQDQPVGYDPSNPQKQKAWNWTSLLGDAPNLNQSSVANAGLLTGGNGSPSAKSADTGTFKNLDVTNPTNAWIGQLLSQNGAAGGSQADQQWLQALQQSAGGAGYGSFKYGMAMPQGGTQEYRDLQEYLLNGGADPYNLYGKKG